MGEGELTHRGSYMLFKSTTGSCLIRCTAEMQFPASTSLSHRTRPGNQETRRPRRPHASFCGEACVTHTKAKGINACSKHASQSSGCIS
jgi:hypothetical protein